MPFCYGRFTQDYISTKITDLFSFYELVKLKAELLPMGETVTNTGLGRQRNGVHLGKNYNAPVFAPTGHRGSAVVEWVVVLADSSDPIPHPSNAQKDYPSR